MELSELNPWWKNGRVEKEYEEALERELFRDMTKVMNDRQIVSLIGLRRVGKTTLLHQVIHSLLHRGVAPEQIVYYTFDVGNITLEAILKQHAELFPSFKEEKLIVFLDEIQKLDGWHNQLKVLYDTHRSLKFFVTGSASLFIEKMTKESLAGRMFSFTLFPLSFSEYLRAQGFQHTNVQLYAKELQEHLAHYLKTGGFPELLHEEADEKIKLYLKDAVLDRLIYIDIPRIFKIEEPELLFRIFTIISANPGMLVDFNRLGSDLGRNRKTISAYLFYLEKALLVKRFYSFSSNVLTSEKKSKKFYPASSAFSFFFNVDITRLAETAVAAHLQSKFFYRFGNKEVDFIVPQGDKVEAIEVKYFSALKKEHSDGLRYFYDAFSEKFDVRCTLITKDVKESIKNEDVAIRVVPLYEWLLKET